MSYFHQCVQYSFYLSKTATSIKPVTRDNVTYNDVTGDDVTGNIVRGISVTDNDVTAKDVTGRTINLHQTIPYHKLRGCFRIQYDTDKFHLDSKHFCLCKRSRGHTQNLAKHSALKKIIYIYIYICFLINYMFI